MKNVFFYLSFIIIVTITVFGASAADIYVAATGSDLNTGTRENPLATIHAALRKAREWRRLNDPAIKGGIKILVSGGTYRLNEPILVRPEDSGTKDSPTEIVALPNESPVISGGIELTHWKKLSAPVAGLPKNAVGKVWVADASSMAGRTVEFRQLWINGKKAIRARNTTEDQMERILGWDFGRQTCLIPWSPKIDYTKLAGAEMLIHQWWAIANLRIKQAVVKGKTVELSFMQPESRIQSEHPWPAPWISEETGNSAFYLTHAIQFLDQPGEWYEDLTSQKVYYWPKTGQDMTKGKAVSPYLETLVKIEGTVDRAVSYFSFKGIHFQHSTWLRPSQMGHVPLQAGMFLLDAYKLQVPGTADKANLENQAWVGRPPAAVEMAYANHSGFENCVFEQLASTGLDYQKGTHNSFIIGNLFKDIGGSGILIGEFSGEHTEAHLPYQPSDEREVSQDDKIQNNLVIDVANEDWGCVGIGAGYVRGINISNNEINEVSYTGISMGWGWTSTPNAMKNNTVARNKIRHYGKRMYDVAAIYTLSAQPGSVIEENDIDSIYVARYAHLPEHWFYLYTDEGTSGITMQNNWTPSQKFLQNANGPGNIWKNNGNMVDQHVKANAGLTQPYRHLLISNSTPVSSQQINVAVQQVIFELVFKEETVAPKQKVEAFCEANQIPVNSIYTWKNRLVIYASSKNPSAVRDKLAKGLRVETKLYDHIFYDFNRKRNCSLDLAKEWEHVILSANLVKDETLQKEYLAYHARQFTDWPELSKGFCNAEFQQLVIYKNGRQLMLVISIPKGKSLDELNPKTTENNPRVEQWNALMKKYQEGIAGTAPGEVWVFFK